MRTQVSTIRSLMNTINAESDLGGGYWLPYIQRKFVWSENQISTLFDSIMRQYSFGTLLIWKTNEELKYRPFVRNYHTGEEFQTTYNMPNNKTRMMVLDGQQRLQSLFIGLMGTYNNKELYFDILSHNGDSDEDIIYKFKFLSTAKAKFPWIKVKDIVFSNETPRIIKSEIAKKSGKELTTKDIELIDDNYEKIRTEFTIKDNLIWQLIDGIDEKSLYELEDVVEIFIRANSGGTQLSKSDLLFSLLTVSWDEADESINELLDELNRSGYKFTRDFLLKTCLVLLDKKAKFDVRKFKNEATKNNVVNNWLKISQSLRIIRDFLRDKTVIDSDKNLPSYLALIPIIYYQYHFPDKWEKDIEEFKQYLTRTLLTGVFGGSPDNLLDAIINEINSTKSFQIEKIFGIIKDRERALELTPKKLFKITYGSSEIYLIFSMWYKTDYSPLATINKPNIDHIFPQSKLKTIRMTDEKTNKMHQRYSKSERDQIANLMLLTAKENQAGGKGDMLPEEWFADKNDAYLNKHLIPKDKELWKLENFDGFIEARKKLIEKKFKSILTKEDED
jgi:uncharacterized protein with ParB-like and HNH nuclease domain